MSISKQIRVNDGSGRVFEENTIAELKFDTKPEVGSFNAVTSDAVARAVAGASGEVPQVTENDNGKVLTAGYDAGGPSVSWQDAAAPYTAGEGIAISDENVISCTVQSPTAGDGIDITGGTVSVKLAENGGLDFKAPSVDGEAAAQASGTTWAKKFHVGTNPQTDAVASFTLKTDLAANGRYPYFQDTSYGGYAVLVLANPADLSQYSICTSNLYGPMPYTMLGGGYSDYIPPDQTCTVSGTMSTLFGNSWTDYVDENGDIYLYLCDVSDNELKGSGYGPGGACAAFRYSIVTWNSLILTSTLAGAAELEASVDQTYDASSTNAQSGVAVAEAVGGVLPSITGQASKVLAVNSGATGLEWVSAGGGSSDQPLPAVATDTLRFEFENMSFDPTNDTGCNFTGTSWAKVTEATTRNIWDCTLGSNPNSSNHFAITEPCKVIDGNVAHNDRLPYLFMSSTGLTAFKTGVSDNDNFKRVPQMFYGCTSLRTVEFIETVGRVFSYLAGGDLMFENCASLTSVRCSASYGYLYPDEDMFDVGVREIFKRCVNLKEILGCCIGSSSYNYGGAGIDITSAFEDCYSLESVDSVFSGATSGGFYSSSADIKPSVRACPLKTAYRAFRNCHSLRSFDYPIMLLASNASAESMFENCASLANVGVIDFMGNAASMKNMFSFCKSLQRVDLIRTQNVTIMEGAFNARGDYTGSSLNTSSMVKLPVFDMSSAVNVKNMFKGNAYADGALTAYNTLSTLASITDSTGCFDSCGSITHASDLAQIPASWGGTGA